MQTATGHARLGPGDRIPAFKTASRANPRFTFDSVAGRWLVLGCLGSLSAAQVSTSLRRLSAETHLFDDNHASLFLMSCDPQDMAPDLVPDRVPGLRVLLDLDLSVSALLGATDAPDKTGPYRPCWIVMDPGLTIRAVFPLTETGEEAGQILDMLARVPPPARYMGAFPCRPRC